jgi:choline dehydrogenase-like flavoprotein
VAALELAEAGFEVVLLESGGRRFSAETQRLAEAAELDPRRHAAMGMATRRQLGGATAIWGGRCVPFDPIDFEHRELLPGIEWPLPYEELSPLFGRACEWFQCGRPAFDGTELTHLPQAIVPGLPDGDVRSSTFERWSLPTDFGREYRRRLTRARKLRLLVGLT